MKMKSLSAIALFLGLATVTATAQALPVELITNGTFETGSLAGWSAVSSNADTGGCDTGWTVSSSGGATGCSAVSNPLGSFAVYQSFDGTGPKTRTLSQTFVVPSLSQAVLSFWDSYAFDIVLNKETPRWLDVNIVYNGVSNNVYHFVSPVGVNTGTVAFAQQTVDLTAALQGLAGKSVQIAFVTTIPENFSGPAGLAIDNISLQAVPGSNVPEPSVLGLLGLGLAGLGMARRRRA